jgi:hypothetical protein
MTIYRKTKNLSDITRARIKSLGNQAGRALAGGQSEDANPLLNPMDCERSWTNAHNASITLGKDRPGTLVSGFGGKGDTHCGSIDIVAGRLAHRARTVNSEGEQIYVDPNFTVDAARVYISQKTDVDDNFRLAKGSQPYAKIRSAVAIKADGVRLIAREGIKLVTGIDKIHSQGEDINNRSYGIDLIANNDDSDLQPLVKGKNLQNCLWRVFHHIDSLAGIIDMFLHSQMEFNASVMAHTHVSAFFGIPVSTSPGVMVAGVPTTINQFARCKIGLVAHYKNTAMVRANYLYASSHHWINSYYNHTN